MGMLACMDLPIGDRARGWRLSRRLTFKQAERASGLWASAIHSIESGQRDPKTADLEALASAYGLSLASFMLCDPPEYPERRPSADPKAQAARRLKRAAARAVSR